MKVIINVVKSNGQGYSLQHNQEIGFKGLDSPSRHFGWYKYKKDALEAAQKLQSEWNKI